MKTEKLEYLKQYKAVILGSTLSDGLVCLGHVVICPVVAVSAIYLGGEGNGNDGGEAVVETWIENVGCTVETLSETYK